MATDERLIHALGCVQAAHGCLLGSTIANAGIMADNLADAAKTINGIIREPHLDLVKHLHRQMAYSMKNFGPGNRTHGVIDHIRKELGEIEAAPHDLEEWVDVALLALDGAWRSGHTPEQIAAGLEAKMTKNESRRYPDWRTVDPDKAIEHIR